MNVPAGMRRNTILPCLYMSWFQPPAGSSAAYSHAPSFKSMTSHLRAFAASSTGVTCTAKSFSAVTSSPAAAGSHSRWYIPGSSSQKSPFAPARSRSTVPGTPFVVNEAVTATSHFAPPESAKSMSTFVFHGHRCVQLTFAVIAAPAPYAPSSAASIRIFLISRSFLFRVVHPLPAERLRRVEMDHVAVAVLDA